MDTQHSPLTPTTDADDERIVDLFFADHTAEPEPDSAFVARVMRQVNVRLEHRLRAVNSIILGVAALLFVLTGGLRATLQWVAATYHAVSEHIAALHSPTDVVNEVAEALAPHIDALNQMMVYATVLTLTTFFLYMVEWRHEGAD